MPVILSCEHARAEVPARYAALFAGGRFLASHRAYDRGALAVARVLARRLRAPLFEGRITRLLVDLNRSWDSEALHGAAAARLPERERQRLVERYWRPYRDAVAAAVAAALARGDPRGRVLHLSCHSFTPVLRGTRRDVDVGLLFDPRRPFEAAVARRLRAALDRREPRLRVRFNAPYAGTADGLTTTLRHRFPPGRYAGLEIEVNQRLARAGADRLGRLAEALAGAVEEVASLAATPGAR